MSGKKRTYRKSVRFTKKAGRRMYIKYLLMLAVVLAVCVLLDNRAREQAVPETFVSSSDGVRIGELAGYLQAASLTPKETRALVVERLKERAADSETDEKTGGSDASDADEATGGSDVSDADEAADGSDAGVYLTAADVEWLYEFLELGEVPETAAEEMAVYGDGRISRAAWYDVYGGLLDTLGVKDEVEAVDLQYLGMLLKEEHLMADSGNYVCDTESVDFVYGETYHVYVMGNMLLGIAPQEDVGDAGENSETGEEETSEDDAADVSGAALPETVRVLITQDNEENIYRENVYVKGEKDLFISAAESGETTAADAQAESGESETVAAGQTLNCLAWMEEHNASEMGVSATDSADALTDGRLSITDSAGTVLASGYTGTLYVYKDKNGLRVVNETSLEAYLRGVVPGEMPKSFAEEALKAQAVCARTYAARLISEKKYEAYGADLDDTTDCQVYLPSAENEQATEAVDATAGQVLTCEGGLATVYYFSTSCGLTSGTEVWKLESPAYLRTISLLTGVSADAGASSDEAAQTDGSEANSTQTESAFGGAASIDEFLRRTDLTAYDSHSRYFRWTAALDMENRLAELKIALQEEIEKGTGRVGVEDTSGTGVVSVERLGGFSGMEIVSRNGAGMVTDLALTFENGRVHIYHENAIRTVLGAAMTVLTDKNGESVNTMTMLPSAAFSADTADGILTLYGGGLGHGIGMSQYGADGMAQAGMEYGEILGKFFPGTEMQGE